MEIVEDSSWWGKFFCLYQFPNNYPRIRLCGIPPGIPIIYFANGELSVYPKCIRFSSVPGGFFLSQLMHVRTDLSFRIDVETIKAVEPYKIHSPVSKYYNFTWTRIRTSRTDFTHDLLVGVGGSGLQMRRIRERHEDLLQVLHSWHMHQGRHDRTDRGALDTADNKCTGVNREIKHTKQTRE